MNILFKDMQAGTLVYALVKDEELKYFEGSIVSVSQPRMEMQQVNGQPIQMPSMRQVVDVTYSLDGKNYTDVVDVTASTLTTKNPGAVSLVSSDKDSIVRELHATLKTSENYLKEAEREVPRQKKRVEKCKELIAQIDTEYKERQQTEARFLKLEEAQKEMGGKLDQILAAITSKNPA